jgi:hypothetical protein
MYLEFVPNEMIVQIVEFESEDAIFAGEIFWKISQITLNNLDKRQFNYLIVFLRIDK